MLLTISITIIGMFIVAFISFIIGMDEVINIVNIILDVNKSNIRFKRDKLKIKYYNNKYMDIR